MKTINFLIIVLITGLFMMAGCDKDDSDNNTGSGVWNLQVKQPEGDTFVLAKGTFNFGSESFSVHIITSRIGGGNIVKEFDMSGQKEGDSIIITSFILNLTDPVEVVTINGRIEVLENTMSGVGNYRIVQPPDTLSYYDTFVLEGQKE